MYKYLVLLFLFLPALSFSQDKLSFQQADSLSYNYFQKGDWSNLKALMLKAFKQEIDSKLMRQRAGYAFFVTGDYTSAKIQYEKALEYDHADELTREYLYYAALNSGAAGTRLYAGNLPAEVAAKLGINRINPVGMIDTEFNLKTNQTTSRSNQVYYRFGINSDLGYGISLYQAFSHYEQTINNELTRQPEYLALVKWSLSPIWQVKAAYHHLASNAASISYPGNMGFIGVAAQWNRFNVEANTSLLNTTLAATYQTGIQAGIVIPGKANLYLNSAICGLYESAAFRTIFAETAGLKCSRNLWAEGNITLGNLKNYSTYNSLYVYNALDPSVFRTGLSLVYFWGRHLSVIGNFTFDQQKTESSSVNNLYYQYSYSGGLKWKL